MKANDPILIEFGLVELATDLSAGHTNVRIWKTGNKIRLSRDAMYTPTLREQFVLHTFEPEEKMSRETTPKNDEECVDCDGTGEITTLDRKCLPCPTCITRENTALQSLAPQDERFDKVQRYDWNTGKPSPLGERVMYGDYLDLLAAYKAKPEAKSEWIPVEQELPPLDQKSVLICSPSFDDPMFGKWDGIAWRTEGVDRFDCMAWIRVDFLVTHWQPLPTPPSGGK